MTVLAPAPTRPESSRRPRTPPKRRGPNFLAGRPGDPAWVRPGLIALLAATAVLYLWNLGASSGNSFYAAAVQAGTQSWKAMLFGSLDAGNAITVDKPALSLWPMEIAGRIFGFNTWSMLVPQALEGVAAVALVYAALRRVSGPAWGLLAGAALAITPAAVLMFRFNNPDAMLVLLLTAASYAVVRALQAGSGRWLAFAGLLVGLGFITKMGQALLVVPAFVIAYLLFAPTGLGRRITHLLGAFAAMVAGAGWYIALVELWPAGSRPYIGGSTNNSMLELALGYNGIGRLFGNTAGNGGGGGGMVGNQSSSFGGATGLQRLFTGEMALEISWLLPAALIALVAGLALTWRAPRTDLRRAALVVFGGSMLVTGLVFSFMAGTIHPYYTIALAPSIAAVLAITGSVLWERRSTWAARIVAAVMVEVTVVWSAHLLGTWHQEITAGLVLLSAIGVLGFLFREYLGRFAAVAVLAALLAGAGGSTAYAVSTASHAHAGSIPSAGPVTSQQGGGSSSSSNTALIALLKATTTRWAAATSGAGSSAPLQIGSGKAVMAIGGFNGSDNAPTLAQFKAWAAAGDIAYYVSGGGAGGGGAGGGGSSAASEIAAWVAANYTATTVGGSTVYDLTA